ncbi:MAG: hypothetical protein C5B47_04720 [Verrucomicrobia bacterium]|nr:MAG: hypothetical protein C5B47_04720 [Verrucomicrobiota bacterium]
MTFRFLVIIAVMIAFSPELPALKIPGGITEAGAGFGCVRSADGGIDYLQLSDGHVSWNSKAADYPLVICQSQIIAAKISLQESKFQIVRLDRAHGEMLSETRPLELRQDVSWKKAVAEDRLEGSLNDDHFSITWTTHRTYSGGAAPPSQILKELGQVLSVCETVDLKSGVVSPCRSKEGLEVKHGIVSVRYEEGFGWSTDPWKKDSNYYWLDQGSADENQVLSLVSSNGRRTRLSKGANLVPTLDINQNYVYVRDQDLSPERRTWSIFAVQTGELVKTVHYPRGARSPALFKNRLLFLLQSEDSVAPQRIVAVDVGSDSTVWEHRTQLIPFDSSNESQRSSALPP